MLKAEFNSSSHVETRLYLEDYVKENIPGFEIREKTESLWMIFLSNVLFFVPGFMTSFITTFYPKVFIPSRRRWESNNLSSITTLAHEYVHLSDRKRMSLVFNFLYLMPQIFVVFALLFPYSNWFLLFLFCLLPLPSPGRAWAEFRGYRMSMAVHYWLTGEKYNIDHIVRQFVSSNYYWMFPFEGFVRSRFEEAFRNIQQDNLSAELEEIKKILTAALFCEILTPRRE